MPHIVFVESNTLGLQALTAAKADGHTVTFVGSRANGYIYGWDGKDLSPAAMPPLPEFAAVDRCVFVGNSMDADALTEALGAIHRGQPIDAVVSVLEYSVHAATTAAARLHLRATSAAAVAVARDKHALRRRLAEAGVETVASTILQHKGAAAEWSTFPAVVKPIAGAASDFVRIVHSPDDLQAALKDYATGLRALDDALAEEIGTGLLVEEYLAGPMLSVEVIVSSGEPRVLTIGQRERACGNEVIELGSLMPADLTPAVTRAVSDHTLAAVRALGFDRGMLHIEVMLTAQGPRLIELNPRLMGGPLPALYAAVYGANVFKLLLAAHLDLPLPEPLPTAVGHGVARVFGTFAGGQLKAPFDLAWTDSFTDCALALVLHARPGGTAPPLRSNHDYLGQFTVCGPTAANAAASADAVLGCLAHMLGVELAEGTFAATSAATPGLEAPKDGHGAKAALSSNTSASP